MLYTPMTKKAILLAYDAHLGQTDKAGIPYILHPARVAADFNTEAEACVAWLHDVVEDTDVTLQDIRLAGYGAFVCKALELLTHDKSVPYMDYVRAIASNPVARAVKLADLRDNMDTGRLDSADPEDGKRLAKYREAYRFLLGEQNRVR